MADKTKIEWCDRFMVKVDRRGPGECWPWTAATLRSGYGVFNIGGSNTTAHRASYMLHVGDPGELHIDHLCRNRACCNPRHLEAVTNAENTRRGLKGSLPTHCKRGHEWSEENTGRNSNGRRQCLACRRARDRRRVRPPGYWSAVYRRRMERSNG